MNTTREDLALADALERLRLTVERDHHLVEHVREVCPRCLDGAAFARVAAELEQAERLRDGLRLALTLIERAQFDAHDREWAREQIATLRALLSASQDTKGAA